MRHQKGDFQLSLGLIVTVIFAVILLTLALAWLSGVFTDIGSVTHKVTDIARESLMQELSSSGEKVGIAAPSVTEWKRGETGSYALGIRNDEDTIRTQFAIGLYLTNPDDGLSSDTDRWFTYSKTILIDAGERDSVDLIIKPTAGARPGIYLFRAIVCKGTSSCTESDYSQSSDTLYGATDFALEIVEA